MPKHPWTPYVITRNSWSFASAPKNAVHFLYGAALHLPALLPPLQSVFAKDTAFLSAKAQKLQNSACAEFWGLFAGFRLGMRFRLWNRQSVSEFSESWIRWLWLVAFSKVGFFRCQSAPGPLYAVPSLFEIGILITEFSAS